MEILTCGPECFNPLIEVQETLSLSLVHTHPTTTNPALLGPIIGESRGERSQVTCAYPWASWAVGEAGLSQPMLQWITWPGAHLVRAWVIPPPLLQKIFLLFFNLILFFLNSWLLRIYTMLQALQPLTHRLLIAFSRWRNWGSEKGSHSFRVTKWIS